MKLFKKIPLFFCCIYIIMMLTYPSLSRTGASNGIILCGQIIIPSLFPFTVCALFLMKGDYGDFFKKIFHQKGEVIFVIILSMLGGYPVGANLVKEITAKGIINKKDAQKLICCCVNAGPAFIVLAVGNGMFQSKELGYILLFSHIFSSVILSLLTVPFINVNTNKTEDIKHYNDQPFVTAVAQAAQSMISICAFIIFFCSFNAYINAWSDKYEFIKDITALTEVTSGIASSHNIYKASFILGFASFSIWFQVFAVSKEIGINLKHFSLFRTLHGSLSTIITRVIIVIFKPSISTVSNNKLFSFRFNYSNVAVSISLFIMLILLILTLFEKNRGRKIYDDLI